MHGILPEVFLEFARFRVLMWSNTGLFKPDVDWCVDSVSHDIVYRRPWTKQYRHLTIMVERDKDLTPWVLKTCTFLDEKYLNLVLISLKFIAKGPMISNMARGLISDYCQFSSVLYFILIVRAPSPFRSSYLHNTHQSISPPLCRYDECVHLACRP